MTGGSEDPPRGDGGIVMAVPIRESTDNTREDPARKEPATPESAALRDAFESFMATTREMDESYYHLESKVQALNLKLEHINGELEWKTGLLDILLDTISEGVITVDQKGAIRTYNRSAENTLGYRADEAAGAPFEAVVGQPFQGYASRQKRELRAKDGRLVPIDERNVSLTGPGGECIGTVKIFEDSSEIEELRKQALLKDRLAALGEMVATIAHEIRNPLGGIRGFAALLERDLAGNESAMRRVHKILDGVKGLERVITDMLEFTRAVDVKPEPVSVHEIAESVLSYVNSVPEGVSVKNRTDSRAMVLADVVKFRQVLINLVLNGVQSIDGPGTVAIDSACGDDFVTIEISDTGKGIPEADLDRVFSPFFTTKNKGTGLGLAVARSIVAAHGGAMRVRSGEGHGTVFTIELPAALHV